MRHLSFVEEMTNVYKILVGKNKKKKPFGGPRYGWKSFIKMNYNETGYKCIDWIHLAQDRKQWRELTALNLQIP
jgi:hypothetical protein